MSNTLTPPAAATVVDPDQLQALVEQAVGDFGSVLNAALVVVGDRLGLYRALAERGSSTPAELAGRPAPSSATSASGCPPRPRPAT